MQAALHRLGGQQDALLRVLTRFVQTYRSGEPGLQQADDSAAVTRWRGICHALGSACGSVGASTLAQALADFAATLVEAATPLDQLAQQARALNAELQIFVDHLALALDR